MKERPSERKLAANRLTIQKAQVAAREKRLERLKTDPTFWTGGNGGSMLAKQQFQVVYDRFGGLALDIYEDFVVWPDQRRPSREKIGDWCKEIDEGTAQIEDRVREATGRRLTAFVQGDGIATMRSAGKVVRKIANAIIAELEKEEPDVERLATLRSLSGIFQHAIAGSSFHLKELVPGKPQTGQGVQYNVGNVRIVSNRGPKITTRPRKLQEIAAPPADVIEAEYADAGS